AGVEQRVHPVPGQKFAAIHMALARPLRTALGRGGEPLTQLGGEPLVDLGIALELLGVRITPALQCRPATRGHAWMLITINSVRLPWGHVRCEASYPQPARRDPAG